MPQYQIYALKYAGPFERNDAMLLWMGDWDSTQLIYYYFWVVKGPDEVIVVDAGVGPDLAKERGLEGYVSPAKMLERMGVKADEVEKVFLTHLHWDHMCGFGLFPKATFYVHEKEYDFWLNDPVSAKGPFGMVSHRPSLQDLAKLHGTDRLVLLKGEGQLAPGLRYLLAPGHTPGLTALAIETEQGTAVLGSDCGHIFQNYAEERPSVIISDLPAWMNSFEKLKKAVSRPELLFPGHDSRMSSEYPQTAPGVSRLA
jgi:glyoxylase-like metal-dependent hydrolase (beta-lactamase superfamily II)